MRESRSKTHVGHCVTMYERMYQQHHSLGWLNHIVKNRSCKTSLVLFQQSMFVRLKSHKNTKTMFPRQWVKR